MDIDMKSTPIQNPRRSVDFTQMINEIDSISNVNEPDNSTILNQIVKVSNSPETSFTEDVQTSSELPARSDITEAASSLPHDISTRSKHHAFTSLFSSHKAKKEYNCDLNNLLAKTNKKTLKLNNYVHGNIESKLSILCYSLIKKVIVHEENTSNGDVDFLILSHYLNIALIEYNQQICTLFEMSSSTENTERLKKKVKTEAPSVVKEIVQWLFNSKNLKKYVTDKNEKRQHEKENKTPEEILFFSVLKSPLTDTCSSYTPNLSAEYIGEAKGEEKSKKRAEFVCLQKTAIAKIVDNENKILEVVSEDETLISTDLVINKLVSLLSKFGLTNESVNE